MAIPSISSPVEKFNITHQITGLSGSPNDFSGAVVISLNKFDNRDELLTVASRVQNAREERFFLTGNQSRIFIDGDSMESRIEKASLAEKSKVASNVINELSAKNSLKIELFFNHIGFPGEPDVTIS